MRIAYVTPKFTPEVGGVETHVARLATRAAETGNKVDLLTEDPTRSLPPIEMASAVRIHRFPAYLLGGRYPFAAGLWRYLAVHGGEYDLIHAHSYHSPAALGVLLARRVPLVLTPHYHGPGSSRLGAMLHRPYRLAGHLLVRRASAIICVSRAEADLLCLHFRAARSRVIVIPNGIDVPDVIEAGAGPRNTILTIGRLKAYKGVDAILEALALLPGFSLSVIGDGPAEAALRETAHRLGIEDRVEFLGRVGEDVLAEKFRGAAVYVTMSSQEAFGLTLADALAQRLPVVASDITSHREVVELAGSARAALIRPDAAPEELARDIGRMAALGRSPVAPDLPLWDWVAERTFEVYDTVLQRTPRRAPPASRR